MTNEAILGSALVLSGLYITYQTYLIGRYRRVLILAQHALQDLVVDLIVREAEGVDVNDTGEHE